MTIKNRIGLIFTLCIFLLGSTVFAQEKTPYKLNLNQAIELGMKNHQQLKISRANVSVSEQQIEVTKLNQLPTISASANAFYLGDALVLNPDFSKVQRVDMPNQNRSTSCSLCFQRIQYAKTYDYSVSSVGFIQQYLANRN